jgi:hypothetical protein
MGPDAPRRLRSTRRGIHPWETGIVRPRNILSHMASLRRPSRDARAKAPLVWPSFLRKSELQSPLNQLRPCVLNQLRPRLGLRAIRVDRGALNDPYAPEDMTIQRMDNVLIVVDDLEAVQSVLRRTR